MKNRIPEFLLIQFAKEKTVQTTNFPEEIKKFMIDYSNFYDWKLTKLNLIFKLMQQNISEIPKCEYADCTNKKSISWDGKITKGCCKDHNTKIFKIEKYGVEHHMQLDKYKKFGTDNIFSDKTYISSKVQEKYGVDNVFKSETVKTKIKKTNIKKYGCENPSQSPDIIEKKNEVWKNKYGGHPFQNNLIKVKIKNTNLEKFGVANPNQSSLVRDKIKSTNLERYGTEYPLQNDEIKEKIYTTNLVKYGVKFPMQNPIFYESVIKKSYTYKEYIWKTGEKSNVQGYEFIVLKELENKGYKFGDILTSTKDMPEIWYEFKGKKHRYFPDFYIPAENLIIEVKSFYTLKKQWNKNQAKFQAVKDSGFNFKLEVR